MSEQQPTGESRPELMKSTIAESTGAVASASPQPGSDTDVSRAGEAATSNKLTPEEQMALFEKELKENDWGHQPC